MAIVAACSIWSRSSSSRRPSAAQRLHWTRQATTCSVSASYPTCERYICEQARCTWPVNNSTHCHWGQQLGSGPTQSSISLDPAFGWCTNVIFLKKFVIKSEQRLMVPILQTLTVSGYPRGVISYASQVMGAIRANNLQTDHQYLNEPHLKSTASWIDLSENCLPESYWDTIVITIYASWSDSYDKLTKCKHASKCWCLFTFSNINMLAYSSRFVL